MAGNIIIADGRNLPFRNKFFDATMILHIFCLLNDVENIMREASRVSGKYMISNARERICDESHGS